MKAIRLLEGEMTDKECSLSKLIKQMSEWELFAPYCNLAKKKGFLIKMHFCPWVKYSL